ncbi:MAG TPA: hypothetical protein DCE41_16200 [Cytophagales bacterium]|nr:hypothetical protein [Cytophagales bacterium]HAA21435.1 hypothetical protein [Cytophagales bacterium]HAP58397.1 hypothetical protein [Cytophagales bacterium]
MTKLEKIEAWKNFINSRPNQHILNSVFEVSPGDFHPERILNLRTHFTLRDDDLSTLKAKISANELNRVGLKFGLSDRTSGSLKLFLWINNLTENECYELDLGSKPPISPRSSRLSFLFEGDIPRTTIDGLLNLWGDEDRKPSKTVNIYKHLRYIDEENGEEKIYKLEGFEYRDTLPYSNSNDFKYFKENIPKSKKISFHFGVDTRPDIGPDLNITTFYHLESPETNSLGQSQPIKYQEFTHWCPPDC